MRNRVLLACAAGLSLLAASPVAAQHDHGRSPYAGHPSSGIASLTPDELRDLETGAGMGLARAAELNHFPGPLHVLELADSLALTAEQLAAVQRVRRVMLERAIELGKQIVELERTLSTRFEHAHVDSATVRQLTADIARLQGELRFNHLAAHLEVRALLSEAQIAAYDRLRGYTPAEGEAAREEAAAGKGTAALRSGSAARGSRRD